MKLYHSESLNNFCIKRSWDEIIYSLPHEKVKESLEIIAKFNPVKVFTEKTFEAKSTIIVLFK